MLPNAKLEKLTPEEQSQLTALLDKAEFARPMSDVDEAWNKVKALLHPERNDALARHKLLMALATRIQDALAKTEQELGTKASAPADPAQG